MPKFDKVILKEGKYRQWNDKKKTSEFSEVTPNRIRKLVDTFQKMREKGLKVPAPWRHDLDMTAFSMGSDGILGTSTENAGFWDNLTVKILEDGKTALVGTIESPGDPNDPNTPAGKIGTIVQDTSIYTRKNMPLTDSQEVLEEAIMHIALVTHPIESNQQNFQLCKDENDSHLIMSRMVGEMEENPAMISQLVNDLREVLKINLPSDTDDDNLVKYLSIAVNQIKLLNSESNSGKDTFELEPLLMSHLDKTQIDALIDGKIVNPKTNKPYCKEDFAATSSFSPPGESQEVLLVMSAMQNSMQSDRRKAYRSRVDSLVESGRTTKTFAESNLYPQADNYNIEFKDGQVVTPMIESLIMSLETMPAPAKEVATSPSNMLVMGGDWKTDTEEDQSKIENTAKYMASLI